MDRPLDEDPQSRQGCLLQSGHHSSRDRRLNLRVKSSAAERPPTKRGQPLNDLAALSGTPAMLVLAMIRLVLTFAMIGSLMLRSNSVRGTRRRYRASTVLRTAVIPVTTLATWEAAVGLAAGKWMDMFWGLVMLSVMPLYFWFANDEDDWWTGRWTKIRKGITAALGKMVPALAPQH